jgi:hypothetical protein
MTYLLLSRDELSEHVDNFVQTRADFESAVITLRTVKEDCGDADGQFYTNYNGSNGVLRISVCDRRSSV